MSEPRLIQPRSLRERELSNYFQNAYPHKSWFRIVGGFWQQVNNGLILEDGRVPKLSGDFGKNPEAVRRNVRPGRLR